MDYFAFDFDGVICNSAAETGLTAWRAARELWPERFAAEPPPEYRARFPVVRPVVETGYDNLPLVRLMLDGASDEAILAGFPELCRDLIRREGLDRERLRQAFGAARDAWIEESTETWLDAQGFYPGVVEAVNALAAPRCIITTKEARFTRILVERAGLEVAPERVYALESFEGAGKRSILEALAAEHPGATLHFFEDRFATLDKIRDLERTRLYLVDWGYNTAAERARAEADSRITLLDRNAFEALLAGGGVSA